MARVGSYFQAPIGPFQVLIRYLRERLKFFFMFERKKMPLRTEQKLRVTNAECENATYSFCNASGDNNTMGKKKY